MGKKTNKSNWRTIYMLIGHKMPHDGRRNFQAKRKYFVDPITANYLISGYYAKEVTEEVYALV